MSRQQQTKAELIEEIGDLRERLLELERRIETGDVKLNAKIIECDHYKREAAKWEGHHRDLKAEADKRLGELRAIITAFGEVKEPGTDLSVYSIVPASEDTSTELGRLLRALYRLTGQIQPKTAVAAIPGTVTYR